MGAEYMNSEFRTINFMYMLNRIILMLNIICGVIMMIFQKQVGSEIYKETAQTTHPYVWYGAVIIVVSITMYYMFKFIIEWAEDTKYVRKSSQEIVELLKNSL